MVEEYFVHLTLKLPATVRNLARHAEKKIGTNFVGLLFIRTESYSLLDKFADLVATLGVQSQPYLPYYQFKLFEFFC